MKIITNTIPREMLSFNDLPLSAQSDFDYLSEADRYSYRLVQYKGNLYDVYDSQRIEIDTGANGRFMGNCVMCSPDSDLAKWNSVISESYFSGKLFKLCDNETVIVGSYYD